VGCEWERVEESYGLGWAVICERATAQLCIQAGETLFSLKIGPLHFHSNMGKKKLALLCTILMSDHTSDDNRLYAHCTCDAIRERITNTEKKVNNE
jgi:hypothetical protein